jgi:hypothetical protein
MSAKEYLYGRFGVELIWLSYYSIGGLRKNQRNILNIKKRPWEWNRYSTLKFEK